ncbi:MAG: 30S ribosomal protein S19 [Candidatus Aenigmarchaeota archaeon]|nr:30S ribosomal protein S19 [Candidatus Aenigmarchaeota archaeon]
MAKFTFRGLEPEQLKQLSVDEFMKMVPSRYRRALKRGFTFHQKKLLEEIAKKPTAFHRTKSRDMVIVPQMLGVKLGVYSGKEYVTVEVTPEMLGYRLGELVLTRRVVKHSAPGFGATKSSKFIPLK